MLADQPELDVARVDGAVARLVDRLAGADRLDVEEDVLVPEPPLEGLGEGARVAARVDAAVADHDPERALRRSRGRRGRTGAAGRHASGSFAVP